MNDCSGLCLEGLERVGGTSCECQVVAICREFVQRGFELMRLVSEFLVGKLLDRLGNGSRVAGCLDSAMGSSYVVVSPAACAAPYDPKRHE